MRPLTKMFFAAWLMTPIFTGVTLYKALIAAAIIAVGLFIYARGQLTEHAICDAKIKYIYLRAHPNITKKNIAANWRVSPQWQLGKPYSQTTTAKRVCQPLEWGCP